MVLSVIAGALPLFHRRVALIGAACPSSILLLFLQKSLIRKKEDTLALSLMTVMLLPKSITTGPMSCAQNLNRSRGLLRLLILCPDIVPAIEIISRLQKSFA